jgi:hypothetical protein
MEKQSVSEVQKLAPDGTLNSTRTITRTIMMQQSSYLPPLLDDVLNLYFKRLEDTIDCPGHIVSID